MYSFLMVVQKWQDASSSLSCRVWALFQCCELETSPLREAMMWCLVGMVLVDGIHLWGDSDVVSWVLNKMPLKRSWRSSPVLCTSSCSSSRFGWSIGSWLEPAIFSVIRASLIWLGEIPKFYAISTVDWGIYLVVYWPTSILQCLGWYVLYSYQSHIC